MEYTEVFDLKAKRNSTYVVNDRTISMIGEKFRVLVLSVKILSDNW